MKGWLAGIGAGLGVLVTAAACRQIVGIGDDPPGTGNDTCGGLPYSGACGACLSAHCCQQASNCAADPTCHSYESCIGRCSPGDVPCWSVCTAEASPFGSTGSIASLETCLASECTAECGLECGVTAALVATPDAAAACAKCIDTNACATFRECLQSSECSSQGYCTPACDGRYDCMTGCGVFGDPQPALWVKAAQAFSGPCALACEAGSNWSCLGSIAPGIPTVSSVHVGMFVVDPNMSRPLPGVRVATCAGDSCAAPVATTDARGLATLNFPVSVQLRGPTGSVGLTSDVDAGTSAIVPERFYWGAPLAGPSLFLELVPVLSSAERAGVYFVAQATPGPMQGDLGLSAVDCNGTPAPDVRFELEPNEPGTRTVYFENGVPSATATATDAEGAAFILNVPPGELTVAALSVRLNRPVSRLNVTVDAGSISWVLMPPLL